MPSYALCFGVTFAITRRDDQTGAGGDKPENASARAPMLDQTAKLKDWLTGAGAAEDDELSGRLRCGGLPRCSTDPAGVKRGSSCRKRWYAILFGPTARRASSAATAHRKPATTSCRRCTTPAACSPAAGRSSLNHSGSATWSSACPTWRNVEPKTGPYRLVRGGDDRA